MVRNRRGALLGSLIAIVVLVGAVGCNTGSGLTGTSWQLNAITTVTPAYQGVIPPADQVRYTISFNAGGQFTGTADCNQVSGSWTTTGSDGIDITPGPTTQAFCGEASASNMYIAGLAVVTKYTISGTSLSLTAPTGDALQFTKK